jgi:hypothetical protein
MFEATTTDGVHFMVRASFWQCMKAGAAATIGVFSALLVGYAILWTMLITGVLTIGALLGIR